MVSFWHWGVRAPIATIGIGALAFAAGGIIEWSLGLSTFAISMLVADAAHHVGAYARRRQRRRQAPPPAAHHSFYDFSDYERPAEQRAA